MLTFGYFYIWVMPIPTGYAAKNLCSCVFVDSIDATKAIQEDLHFSLISMTKSRVDREHHKVTSTLWGMRPQTAIFRGPKYGCTLLHDDQILSFPSPSISDTMALYPWIHDERNAIDEEINRILSKEIKDASTHSRAWLVVQDGKIVGEQYAPTFDSTSVFLGWSMSKSILATMVGHLVMQGKIKLDDPAPVGQWNQDHQHADITWKHLLQMNSGLDWKEVYAWRSNATRMLYLEEDVYDFTADRPAAYPPGQHWMYSSGTSNLLSGLLREIMQDDAAYHALPFTSIAYPLGMQHFTMEMDGDGNYIASSYSHATAREWATFGMLYLQKGLWNGKQIFPPWWSAFVATASVGSHDRFGAHFWLNADHHLPDVPADTYIADGFMGQRVFIIPSRNVVVVRLGLSLDVQPDFNAILRDILDVLPTNRDTIQ